MTTMMRCARLHEADRTLTLEEVPTPELGRDEVRVRIRAAGICATELHFLDGFYAPARFPMILGHEVAGEVAEVGPDAPRWRIGDRVVVNYYLFCGACRQCLSGRHNLCVAPRGWMAFQSDGGFAEQVVVPAHCLVALPDSLSFEDAAPLACSAATAVHACRRGGIEAGDVVVVYGAGGVGQSVLQVAARVHGARVVAIDRSEASRDAALRLGADLAVSEDEAETAVDQFSLGAGADAVFELVGRDATLRRAQRMLGRRGRLVILGYSEDDLVVAPFSLVAAEQSIVACAGNTQRELETAVDLAARGVIGSVVADVQPFERVNEQLERLRRGDAHGRLVLVL